MEYKILKDLVSFNTINDNENAKIINYIENYLKKLNFKTEYKEKCLIMSIGTKQKVGFLGHTDTVEVIEGWETNPFDLKIKNDKIYGLGTCDMKGGIAAMLEAISKIDFSKLKYGMKVYFTYDEETNFKGILDIIKLNEIFPDTMIFGEPTNNEYVVGSKGLLQCEINFKGIKVHSSNPEKGKSANMNAVYCLHELNEFYNKEIKTYKEEKFEVPYTTLNVGLINGGSACNSVSANCSAFLDFRIANKNHLKIIKDKLNKLANKYDGKVIIMKEIEPFINKVENISNEKTANYITEASFIVCKQKILLGTGPITAHEINEHISEKSYSELIEQYMNLIEKFCTD